MALPWTVGKGNNLLRGYLIRPIDIINVEIFKYQKNKVFCFNLWKLESIITFSDDKIVLENLQNLNIKY